jgi:hypothetical protein
LGHPFIWEKKRCKRVFCRILASRNQVLSGQTAVIDQRIRQYYAEIDSLKVQIASGEVQLRFVAEELSGVGELFDKGLEKKSRLLALKREAARLKVCKAIIRGGSPAPSRASPRPGWKASA